MEIRNMTNRTWLNVTVMVLSAALLLPAQKPERAESLLQAATKKETVDGDLPAAIDGYKKALAAAKGNRVIAARALYQLAQCYRKQGNAEARKTLELLVRDYADQPWAAQAREQLVQLGGAAPASGPSVRLLYSGIDKGNTGDVSADGRYITYTRWVDNQDLMLFDTVTGEHRVLYKQGAWENHPSFGFRSHISPDGKHVAFILDSGVESTLLVVAIQGGALRKIRDWKMPEWGSVYGWTPDGRSLFYVATSNDGNRHFGLVSAADGKSTELFRVPENLFLRFETLLRVSRDGRFAAFARFKSPGAKERDIYVKSLAGSEEPWPLVADTSDDYLMDWTPDGNHILFGSDRAQEGGTFLLAVRDGKAQGSPVLLKQNLGDRYPMGFDRLGRYYFNVNSGDANTYHLVGFDQATGKASGDSRLVPAVRGVAEGRWAVWMADGRRIAYLRGYRRGAELVSEYIVVDVNEGKETDRVRFARDFSQGLMLKPDGTVFVARPLQWPPPIHPDRLDTATGRLESTPFPESNQSPSACATPSTWVEVTENAVEIYDATSLQRHTLLERQKLPRQNGSLAVSPDCRTLVWRDDRNAIRALDLAAGRERELVAAQDGIRPGSLSFTPNGQRLLFGKLKSPSQTVELWSLSLAEGAAEYSGISIQGLSDVRVSPDGQRLLYRGGQHSFDAYIVENLLPAAGKTK
jgi:Tol biopolymer transport system component